MGKKKVGPTTIVERVNDKSHEEQYRIIRELNSKLFDAVSPMAYFKTIVDKLRREFGYDIQ